VSAGTSEALAIIAADLDETRDLALNGNKALIAKVGAMESMMREMHSMLLDVIRSDASRAENWERARVSDREERSKLADRIGKLEHLKMANGGAR
jgi:hypothetical protein